MKCPRCRGIGSVPYHIADDMFDEDVCPVCNGTGEVEQTNEEWLCSIPTEEKANFLVMVEMLGMSALKRSTVDIEKFTEEVIAWLKQPYKGVK